jgi:HEAT repeat protein
MKLDERERQEGSFEELRWSQTVRPGIAQRLILLGEPGGGKTCASRYTMAQLARESAGRLRIEKKELSEVILPLWITATHLLEQPTELSAPAAVIGALDLQSQLRSKLTPRLRQWLVSRVTEPGCLVAIDGLDELHATQDTKAELFSARLSEMGAAATSLLVTCRTLPWERLKGLVRWQNARQTVELAPLDQRQQREYTKAFFAFVGQPALATLVDAWLQKQPALRNHARTPLILTFACGLSLEDNLGDSISLRMLYNRVIFSLLEGAWRANRDSLPNWTRNMAQRERVRLFLGALVWPLFKSSPAVNRFNLATWSEAWNQAASTKETPEDSKDQLVEHLCQLGLLVDGGVDEAGHPCWSFAHRTVLEFLVADYVVAELPPEDKSAASKRGWGAYSSRMLTRLFGAQTPLAWLLRERCPFLHAPEWHQVLVFLAELLPRPSLLLDAIQRNIEFGGEDVFLSLTSLRHELLLAVPAGTKYDAAAQNRAKAWLVRWTSIILTRREFVEEPEIPLLRKVPTKALRANQFMNRRLLDQGLVIARHPAAANEITKALIEWLREGELDQVRREHIQKRSDVSPSDLEILNFQFSISVEEFRDRVVMTLGRFGEALNSDLANSTLISILESRQESETLRATAAWALRSFASGASVDALINALETSDVPKIREASAESLGKIGSERAVPALVKALAASSENGGNLRYISAVALTRIASPDAIDGLRAALRERDNTETQDHGGDKKPSSWADVELETEKLINRFRDTLVPAAAAQALISINSQESIGVLLETLKSGNDEKARSRAAIALGDSTSDAAFEGLRDALDPRQANAEVIRCTAASGLGLMGRARGLPYLLDALKPASHNSDSIQRCAVAALGDLGSEEAIGPLSETLCSKDLSLETRIAAAEALGKIGSESSVIALDTALSICGSHDELLQAIFLALSEIGSPTSLTYFLRAIQPTNHHNVRGIAVKALGNIGSSAAVDDLLAVLYTKELRSAKDEPWEWIHVNELRKEAAIALRRIGSEMAVDGLLAALDPENREETDRREQQWFEDIESKGTITKYSVCEDWEVRAEAALALRRIGVQSKIEEVWMNLIHKLWQILVSEREDHWKVKVWTREALEAICKSHRRSIRSDPKHPPFLDITTF